MRQLQGLFPAARAGAACCLMGLVPLLAAADTNPAGIDWQQLSPLAIARTETTVAQFRRYAEATRTRTLAEREGGGEVYEAGWVHKPNWTWRAPFGKPALDDEPAVHITWHEAQAFCRWAGGRLPSDAEWVRAAYTEQRPAAAAAPFVPGRSYPYPSGSNPAGAACLGDCANPPAPVAHGAALLRGAGHALATRGTPGVNGLLHMGGNAWEWVDEPAGAAGEQPRRTRGGSWWYGAAQMQAGHLQSKPPGTAVVYIGFRCAR